MSHFENLKIFCLSNKIIKVNGGQEMGKIVLGEDEYYDKVKGCWLGKIIGGTLGGPWEGRKHTHMLTFYEPVPEEPIPNDDLDLQLIWLKMLEEEGIDPSIRIFAEYWAKYACRYPWNEYGFFMRNYERGLKPPIAGCFENYYVDEMGSPIRSEIWACLHPADPQSAARMAWKDSSLDHAGGEGMYGEMFLAAMESAAFVIDDPKTLIKIGLNMIPLSSHISRCVREVLWCYENGRTWGETREKIATLFGHYQPCNAVPNIGFIIIGLLYGKDFGDKLCKAVNCGYDTDCTGATLGSILGIMYGAKKIPQEWIKPIGNKIVLHKFTKKFNSPSNIDELTERVVYLGKKSVEKKENISFGRKTKLPEDILTNLFQNELARKMLLLDIHSSVELMDKNEIWLHYNGEPVIYPGIGKKISLSSPDISLKNINLILPEGWKMKKLGEQEFLIFANQNVENRNIIEVEIDNKKLNFVLLGPKEGKGFEAGRNVASCKKCGARIEECMCGE